MSDASVTEGDVGAVEALFDMTLKCPTAVAVTFGCSTVVGTASAGEDYEAITDPRHHSRGRVLLRSHR